MSKENYIMSDLDGEAGTEDKTKDDGIVIEVKEDVKVKPYAGMRKEELLLHSGTRFWKNFRSFFIWLVLLSWVVLIATSIAMIVVFPRCKIAKKTHWWEEASVYWIYPKSFQDTNGDGVGDIKGIENRLPNLSALGANTILLDTVLTSSNQDFSDLESGYDVTDFVTVDAKYGNMAELETLINKTHDEGLKFLMTFVPNHTGDKHPWFIKSRANETNAFRSYYVWADCGLNGTTMPNNWLSMTGGSAWTYDATRKQCYLHQGSMYEPDLNYRNSDVQKKIQEALTFWLLKGVDGFYIPRASYLFEDFDLRDDPKSNSTATGYKSLDHVHTQNLASTHDMIKRWRMMLDAFTETNGGDDKFLLLGGWGTTSEEAKKFYMKDEAIEVMNEKLLGMSANCGGTCVKGLVDGWLKDMDGQTANWPVTSPSVSRPATRYGTDHVNALNMLSLLLPGTSVSYYGSEIGMVDSTVAGLKRPTDIFRSPMQWTNGSQAGFTNGSTPWMAVNPDYTDTNVFDQGSNSTAVLNVFKKLVALRKMASIKPNARLHYAVVNDNIFSFVKEWDGETRYLVAINVGKKSSEDNYNAAMDMIPSEATVIVTTENGVAYKDKDSVATTSIKLDPQQGVVLSWDYIIKNHL